MGNVEKFRKVSCWKVKNIVSRGKKTINGAVKYVGIDEVSEILREE